MPEAEALGTTPTTSFYAPEAPSEAPEPIRPELLDFLAELASREASPIREYILAIIEDYIIDWLEELRPLPYIENLILEIASRRYWLPELVETLGASSIVEAMKLAYLAAHSTPEACQALLSQLVGVEEALIQASGIEPGEKIREVMSSSDCRLHALLIAHLIATRPYRG